MKDRLIKSIQRLKKLKVIKEKNKLNFEKGLNSYEIKVFRQLREKYDLSLESNEDNLYKGRFLPRNSLPLFSSVISSTEIGLR